MKLEIEIEFCLMEYNQQHEEHVCCTSCSVALHKDLDGKNREPLNRSMVQQYHTQLDILEDIGTFVKKLAKGYKYSVDINTGETQIVEVPEGSSLIPNSESKSE